MYSFSVTLYAVLYCKISLINNRGSRLLQTLRLLKAEVRGYARVRARRAKYLYTVPLYKLASTVRRETGSTELRLS